MFETMTIQSVARKLDGNNCGTQSVSDMNAKMKMGTKKLQSLIK